MREVYPPLAKASSRLFIGLDEEGEPQYKDNDTPVTLLHMLNQSSGVGMEFGDKVQSWKEYTRKTGGKGGGFVNSCKVVSMLVRVHPTSGAEPRVVGMPAVEQLVGAC